ncbi:hypothetical protein CROQUDRAFT_97540 [Cronartium quercuum f. sp. fusiforme G11]|uniref:Peptidase S59 domain-containing protein n=1 Tax=Cronartium quercuum f. sp. fusiforme G11 TaxID=708437 RepID=A0A9P6NDW8_9BASI|nr:hypothetical protein CROQUDRAFT_97540 [Cronartium quercuum f. sp. fusiforme G11]
MFGASNTFGGFGSNNQQQQQQPQTSGLFGAAPQPAASGGFNVFGQQPSTTTGFAQPQASGFGSNTFGPPASTTPFGTTAANTNAFGQPQQNTTSLFGAPAQPQAAPSTGFGGFGTAAPNTTFGGFGAGAVTTNNTNTGAGLFGAKPAVTNTFGTTTTGFGNNAFGQAAVTPFGATNTTAAANGTANPLYAAHTLVENESTPSQKSTFNSISAMDAYKNWSFEELRFQDYMQGRKTAVPTNNAFGAQQSQQPAGFGGFNANTNANQPGGFNQPQQQAGIFGNPAPAGNAFGLQAPAGGIFGQQAAGATNAFGQTQNNTNNAPFGAPAAQPANAFGNNSLFGSNTTSNAFGAQPAKPSIFGNTTNTFGASTTAPATNNLFGQANTTQTQGGLFGAQPNQTQPSTGLFGQNTTNTGTTGLFGNNNNQNTTAKPGGLFGSTGQSNSLFGQTQPNQATTASPFGFGQNNQQTTQPGAGGLFGNNNQSAQNAGGGLFGNNSNAQQQQPATTGGLFGNTATNNNNAFGTSTGGLFGNNTNNNSINTTGGLFGQKPLNSSTSLFGNKDGSGQQNTNNFNNSSGGGLFGSSAPSTGFSFGNNNNTNNNSLFGSTNNAQNMGNQQGVQNGFFQSQQNNQPLLQAQVDQGAYGNNPIFANHGNLGGSKPAVPIKKQLPTIDFKPIPRPNTKITKLRGFARSTSPAKSVNGGSPLGATHSASSLASTVSRSSAYGRPNEEPLLSPKAFIVRPSPKKLIIDPNTLSSMLRDRSATLDGSPGPINGTPPPKAPSNNIPIFNPDAEVSALHTFSKNRQSTAETVGHGTKPANSVPTKSPTHTITSQPTSPNATQNEKTAQVDGSSAQGDVVVTTREKAKKGEYWTIPTIHDLQLLSRKDLRSLPHFTVGRNGFGQIMFQEDVDLTGIPNLEEDLCGEVIVFKQSLCSVYPDDPVDKPPVGEGLNVPAVITLENCWAIDKATREPIKDPSHPRVKQFTKRLMKSEDTQFVEYDAKSGKWTFIVEHFTTYGIDDSDEENENGDRTADVDEETEHDDQYTESEVSSPRADSKSVTRSKRTIKPSQTVVDSDEEDGPPQMMLFGDEDENEGSQDAQMFEVSASSGLSGEEEVDGDSTSCITGSDGDDVPINPLGKKRPREASSAEGSQSQLELAPRSQNWRAQLGIESKKVAVMQASLFPGTVPVPPKTKPIAPVRRSPWTSLNVKDSSRSITDKPNSFQTLPVTSNQQPDISATEPNVPKTVQRKMNSKVQCINIPNRCTRRIPLSKSIIYGHEGSTSDASLALARSFRISWTNQSNQLIHFQDGEIGNMTKTEQSFSTGSVLVLRTIPTMTFALFSEIESAERLLEVQLCNTTIEIEDGIPFIITNPELRFRDFVAAYDKTERGNDFNIWQLGSALYDELDLRIPKGATAEAIERIKSVRREDSFSQWLQQVISPSVEHDLRSSGTGAFSGIFKLLAGNQIERACNASIQAGNYRLATLIAQCGRSDSSFKADILQQNIIWHELRTDAYINRDLRKIYELMSGNVTLSKGFGNKSLHVDHSEDIQIAEGLDWKRNLGIHFWFQASHVNFWYAVKTYEEAFTKEGMARAPLPWYLEKQDRQLTEKVVNDWKHQPTHDAMFDLIKMFVEPTYALETVLEPRGFGPSPFDYRMPWHLYLVLSRVMRVRDFEDREIIMAEMDDEDGEAVEGTCPTADLLTTQYSTQLGQLGLHKWAVFVLLHLEHPQRRMAAIQSFLSKNIRLIDSDTETFLKKTLKIPSSWIYTAHAEFAQYQNRFYDQYCWLMKAEAFTDAHRVVVQELAPEAVIRGDLSGLKELFSGLCSDNVADWPSGGKIFLDYVKIIEQLPVLLRVGRGEPIESNSELTFLLESVLPNLLREIPLVYSRRGRSGMKHKVCMSEMMSNLVNTSTSVALVVHKYDYTNDFINLNDLQTSDKLLWTQRCAVNGFVKALTRAGGEEVV